MAIAGTGYLRLSVRHGTAARGRRIQRESVRKQAEFTAEWLPPRPKEIAADCDPIPDLWASVLLGVAAANQHVDPKLLRGVIIQESGFPPVRSLQ